MNRISLEVDFKEVKRAINRLNPKQKAMLIDDLEKETRPIRWYSLVKKIRQRKSRYPITDKEIAKICGEVRQKRHERG